MRARRWCSRCSGSKANRYVLGDQDRASTLSQTSSRRRARPTAPRSRSGMNRNGRPHDTACGPFGASSTSASSSDSMAARSARAGAGGPNSGGRGARSRAETGRPSRARTETSTGPTPSSRTMGVVSPSSAISPMAARTCAVPIVGCPANGSSALGVKMRMRRVCCDDSGGRTKTVSEKLNSRAALCIWTVVRFRPSERTASWLPPKMRSVKTSAVRKRWRMSVRCRPVGSRQTSAAGSSRQARARPVRNLARDLTSGTDGARIPASRNPQHNRHAPRDPRRAGRNP